MAFPPESYHGLKHREPAFIALRHCADVCALDWLAEFVAENPDVLARDFLRCFTNFRKIETTGPTTELEHFDIAAFWMATVNGAGGDSFDPADGRDLLSGSHLRWAWHAFTRRGAEHAHDQRLGSANTTAHRADALLNFVRQHTANARLIPTHAWNTPCPPISTNNDFVESLPRFCSAFALAARAAGERRLNFADAMTALRGQELPEKSFTDGLRALLELAPELLGFFLLFWQSLIKISPHHD